MANKEDKTKVFYDKSVKLSKLYGGRIEILPKVPIKSLDDFSIWYTPGVAGVSRKVNEDKDLSFDYTWRWNTVAIVTDGTRVLGLGNIGPEAAIPVMEGKALLFKYLGGVDAIPLTIRADEKEKFIEAVKTLEPSFGGFNLEDIESPKCFYLLEKLRDELNVPVWHDDQQGTATIVLAGLTNALKVVGKKINEIKVAQIGTGGAGLPTINLLMKAGVKPENVIAVDIDGILHANREDMDRLLFSNRWLYELALKTNPQGITGGIKEAMEEADVVIAFSKPVPGTIKKEWVKKMADNSIIFACANPLPEIWPWNAKEAGAKVVATGRSDFPNQVNNSLAFPGIFRGVLDVRAKAITDELAIEAATTLPKYAEEKGINENYILPTMEEWRVFPLVASAVASKAIQLGIAKRKASRDELYSRALDIIKKVREKIKLLMDRGIIETLD